MPRSMKEIAAKANQDILKRHYPGLYRPISGPDGETEHFAIVSATEWQGNEVVISVTDYLINMTDRDWHRGDQVVTETEGTYEVHGIVNREAGMLTLRTVKL